MAIQTLVDYVKSVSRASFERKTTNDESKKATSVRFRSRKRTAYEAFDGRYDQTLWEPTAQEIITLNDDSLDRSTDLPLDLSATGCRKQIAVNVDELRLHEINDRHLASCQDTVSHLASCQDTVSHLASCQDTVSHLASCQYTVSHLASSQGTVSHLASCQDNTDCDENELESVVVVTANSSAFKKTLLQRYNASVHIPRVNRPHMSPNASDKSWSGSLSDGERSPVNVASVEDHSSSSPLQAPFDSSFDLPTILFSHAGEDGHLNLSKTLLPANTRNPHSFQNSVNADIPFKYESDPIPWRANEIYERKLTNLASFETYNPSSRLAFCGTGESRRIEACRRPAERVQDNERCIQSGGGWKCESSSGRFGNETNESVKSNVEEYLEQSLRRHARLELTASNCDASDATLKQEPRTSLKQENMTSGSNVVEDDFETIDIVDEQPAAMIRRRRQGSGTSYLWQFLLELLANSEYSPSCISWVDRKIGTFRLSDTKMVSKLWGLRKNRPSMSYETMGRALRYYYTRGILNRVQGQRLVYQFAKLPVEYSF